MGPPDQQLSRCQNGSNGGALPPTGGLFLLAQVGGVLLLLGQAIPLLGHVKQGSAASS
jgi:hypothetical protein